MKKVNRRNVTITIPLEEKYCKILAKYTRDTESIKCSDTRIVECNGALWIEIDKVKELSEGDY